jgi:hypothetical protein
MRGDNIKGRLSFNILTGISSYPCEFFDLSDLTIPVISFVGVGVRFILGNGLVNTCLR